MHSHNHSAVIVTSSMDCPQKVGAFEDSVDTKIRPLRTVPGKRDLVWTQGISFKGVMKGQFVTWGHIHN